MSCKNWEKIVKKRLTDAGHIVLRGDYKNKMPDWLALCGNRYFFVECKDYRSEVDGMSAINSWKSKQKNQYKNFLQLAKKKVNIALWIRLKKGDVFYQFNSEGKINENKQ